MQPEILYSKRLILVRNFAALGVWLLMVCIWWVRSLVGNLIWHLFWAHEEYVHFHSHRGGLLRADEHSSRGRMIELLIELENDHPLSIESLHVSIVCASTYKPVLYYGPFDHCGSWNNIVIGNGWPENRRSQAYLRSAHRIRLKTVDKLYWVYILFASWDEYSHSIYNVYLCIPLSTNQSSRVDRLLDQRRPLLVWCGSEIT